MRTILPAIVLLLLTSMPTLAQNQQNPEQERRLKGGLVFSKLSNTEWESSTEPGFALGLSLGFPLSEALWIQPEVLYMEKGSRETLPGSGTEYRLTLDYVEVPLLAKYKFASEGVIQPNLYLGPYAAFLIENHSDIQQPGNEDFTPDKLVNSASDSEFGVVAGVGTDLQFTFNTISLELRYSAGLSDVFDTSLAQKIRNGSLVFMAGFSF